MEHELRKPILSLSILLLILAVNIGLSWYLHELYIEKCNYCSVPYGNGECRFISTIEIGLYISIVGLSLFAIGLVSRILKIYVNVHMEGDT